MYPGVLIPQNLRNSLLTSDHRPNGPGPLRREVPEGGEAELHKEARNDQTGFGRAEIQTEIRRMKRLDIILRIEIGKKV